MHRKGLPEELMTSAPYTSTASSYSNSKLAMVLYTYELQRRLREAGGRGRALSYCVDCRRIVWPVSVPSFVPAHLQRINSYECTL